MQLHPKQFSVNDCWLAFPATREPVDIEGQPAHVYVLQDAASMFILGNAFAPAAHNSPSRDDAAALLRRAWETKREWCKKLVLLKPASEQNGFAEAARWNGIPVEYVPKKELALYIKDVQSSYEEFINRGDPSDA